MIYKLAISDKRKMQWANQLLFPTSHVHSTRNLDFHDFVYLLSGEWEIAIGKESYVIKPNDVLLLPAGITHRGGRPCAPNTELIYVHVYPVDGDSENYTDTDSDNCVTINNLLSTTDYPQIKVLFQKLVQLTSNPTLFIAYTNVLLYELSTISSDSTDATLARQIRDYLLSSSKTPSNKEVAAQFFLSIKTVENVFKRTYGMSMHQYAMRHKLNCAKQYLRDYPDITIFEIAQILNFCDEHHLSRMFKKEFGVSPGKYRKNN